MKNNKKELSPEKVKKAHEKLIAKMDIPKWILDRDCFRCGEKFENLSIRGISLYTNASKIGDVGVEVACYHCKTNYDFFYRKACNNVNDFISFLAFEKEPFEPESQFTILKHENNLVDYMTEEIKKEKNKNDNSKNIL